MFEQKVSLETIAAGAVKERFESALSQVIENINDLNTEPETVREITIKLKIKPNENRQMAGVRVDVTNKLASHKHLGTAFYFGVSEGEMVAVEHNPRQLGFDSLMTPVKDETKNAQ